MRCLYHHHRKTSISSVRGAKPVPVSIRAFWGCCRRVAAGLVSVWSWIVTDLSGSMWGVTAVWHTNATHLFSFQRDTAIFFFFNPEPHRFLGWFLRRIQIFGWGPSRSRILSFYRLDRLFRGSRSTAWRLKWSWWDYFLTFLFSNSNAFGSWSTPWSPELWSLIPSIGQWAATTALTSAGPLCAF